MGNCNTKKYESTTAEADSSLYSPHPKGGIIHEGSILGLKCFNNFIATGSDDKRIAILNKGHLLSQSDCKPMYLEGHSKAVNRLCYHNNHLWSISRDLSIRQVSFLLLDYIAIG